MIAGAFSIGDNVTVSGFRSQLNGTPINFNLSNAHNATFDNMEIVGRVVYDNVSGRLEIANSSFSGGQESYGVVSGVNAEVIVRDNEFAANSPLRIEPTGTGTTVDFTFSNNRTFASTTANFRAGATGNVRIDDNTLSYPNLNYVSHHDGSSGNVSFSNNTILESSGLGGGGLNFRNASTTGGSGTIVVRNNNATNCNGSIAEASFDAGAYDVLVLNNTSTRTSNTNYWDVNTRASNNARVRLRAEENVLARTLGVALLGNAQVDAGIFNNRVGVSNTQFSGVIFDESGFSGQLTTVIRGNNIGNPPPSPASGQITVERGTGTVRIERLSTLGADNNVNGGFIQTGQTSPNPATLAPDGATSLPPIP